MNDPRAHPKHGNTVIAQELATMLQDHKIGGKFKVARTIVQFSARAGDDEYLQAKAATRPISGSEARRLVAEAVRRIELADAPD